MPPVARRPGTVITAAVILLIVSTLSLLGGACAIVVGSLMPNIGGKDNPALANAKAQQEFIANQAPAFEAVTWTKTIIHMALSVVQLLAAIGLLSMSSPARTAAILSTAAKVFLGMLDNIYQAIYVLPAQREFIDQNPLPQAAPFDMGALTQTIGGVALVIAAAFQLAIGGLIIGLLLTRSAREGFAAALAPPIAAEDKPRSAYEGYDDDGYNPPPPETGIQDRPS